MNFFEWFKKYQEENNLSLIGQVRLGEDAWNVAKTEGWKEGNKIGFDAGVQEGVQKDYNAYTAGKNAGLVEGKEHWLRMGHDAEVQYQKRAAAEAAQTIAELCAKLKSNEAWHLELEARLRGGREVVERQAKEIKKLEEQGAANTKLYQEAYTKGMLLGIEEGKKVATGESYRKGKNFILDEVKRKVGNVLQELENLYGATEK